MRDFDEVVFNTLLKDRTTGKNIIWGANDYEPLGKGYGFFDPIEADKVTDEGLGRIIVPRSVKSRKVQKERAKKRAEVFTPSWICNDMCNLIDDDWFEKKGTFNTAYMEDGVHKWTINKNKVTYPKGKDWKGYVKEERLEITCGEAPFMVSRYDTTTGKGLEIKSRIGFLDRKLRIVDENTGSEEEWKEWALNALKATYGYEWQGDNLLLARENVLFTMLDYYHDKFRKYLDVRYLRECAVVISWNFWQMDGLKCVVPMSCHDEEITETGDLFSGEVKKKTKPCEGCKKKDVHKHNGIYCNIMDWGEGHAIRFTSLMKE